ncbi:bifunctional folylpolyglutamate synthase/dihydrofolate synthase [Sulfurimonas sp.]|uniref:bifunctional folylpolyglutamate synthase/dihydrofolate synthase n=1 Tax=Sulfurimonas sp. TaxID=2022749 RepID=UPI0025E854DD|nr:bifunctional folylpolyglutamate synthase/dihydrofolate synthase [Sulfurimonas sp.]MCK9473146.1 bifunctional folylpolyglutamate synthase/dihydrofolate synthase [Sulfurimonas sp.]MDD3505204.1 bifunctional folylpolyglutamate synthase/dihydrofolate synthase [Sulfurimonas sp.]
MILEEYLNLKPLYYEKIDYERMPRIYKKIKSSLSVLKIIHIIGTNGKGTTGRFLANALFSMGFCVGHYTSPHILEFNERIWKDGANISDAVLEEAHQELQKILTKDDAQTLSYFEYTTFLAMLLFRECDYVVMEAGLGGEHDATAVFAKILTLVTPIAYDHEAFLGSSIDEIAVTKLNAINKSAILGIQKYDEVYRVADRLCAEKSLNIQKVDAFIDDADRQKIGEISKKLFLAPYLVENLSLSIAALKFLNLSYGVENFSNPPLFGRLTKISENIIVDVGHNVLAASGIVDALLGNKYVVVYNSYKDKNYKEILTILKPIILHVEIIVIDDVRAAQIESIKTVLTDLEIKYELFKEVKPEFSYLVFGSFSVVETFLREYYE